MFQKSKALLVAALLASGVGVASAPAAQASVGCATRAMYRNVHQGQTRYRVSLILHEPGHATSDVWLAGYHTQLRQYRNCSTYGVILVEFQARFGAPLRVILKSASWF
jgi:hypothetical protein